MPMTLPALLAALLLAAALSVPAVATAGPALAPLRVTPVEVGIGDQKVAMFTDDRFTDMGIGHTRLLVPWDALMSSWQRPAIAEWMAAAREADVEPLITFGHSRLEAERRVLPTPSQFRYQFRQFRKKYPWVRNYATWNEANHCGEPTCNRPDIVAAYYRAIKAECASCRVLAAEMLDMPNMVRWVKAFRKAARVEPRFWGLHNYIDANRFRKTSTMSFIKATKGEIWLTETGGIVKRRTKVRVALPESAGHAARAMRWLFDRLVPLSPRITRVYLYHWNSSTARDSWDSAFIDHKGRARPSLTVLRNRLLPLP